MRCFRLAAPEIRFDGLDWQKQRVILYGSPQGKLERLRDIAEGMLLVLERHPDTALLLPLHRNPVVNPCRLCSGITHSGARSA